MKGFVIVHYNVEDNNSEAYRKYLSTVDQTINQYGGKTIVADSDSEILEGNPKQKIVVLEFESTDIAKEWYNSGEYTAIKDHRISTTKGWMVVAKEYGV
ncbi:MAG: DUF1330 domain-containing protein [Candidatus Kariarchaeaceae archaeon]|jgi:uncharacterized protein (DUF1330 family)